MELKKDFKINIGVYVVDNDPDLLEAINILFKKNNMVNFMLFNNHFDFLKNLQEDKFHICVLDYYLAGSVTALELLNQIHKQRLHVYSIVMSAQEDMDVMIDLLNEGAINKYLRKGDALFSKKIIDFINDGVEYINSNYAFYFELQQRFSETKKQLKNFISPKNKSNGISVY